MTAYQIVASVRPLGRAKLLASIAAAFRLVADVFTEAQKMRCEMYKNYPFMVE